MDTIHDLGGRQGFGPINWRDDDDNRSFHADWEARTWAMCMMLFGRFRQEETGWTIDWHRHVIERTGPAEYLRMNYFDKWVQNMMATMIDVGVADLEEFVESRSLRPSPPFETRPLTASRDPDPPRFKAGDSVLTKREIGSMHTRLPAYARGRNGTVIQSVGPEIFADASATGDIRKEPQYTVEFDSSELWPGQAGGQFAVHLDLWDSYLEPA